jgi:nodulation protein E
VVVTGMGCVTPLGHDVASFWSGLVEGRTGLGPLTALPTDKLSVKIGGEVRGLDLQAHFPDWPPRRADRFALLAVIAARQAAAQAGLQDLTAGERDRCAVVLGTGAAAQGTLDEGYHRLYAEGASRLHPLTVPQLMINGAVSNVAMDLGLRGPAFAVASACAAGNHAVEQALRMVAHGQAELAVAGASEACITYGTLKGWEGLRVMATDTCRPFSAHRRGMVLAEGAAVVVMEPRERAEARGAPILAEIAGAGLSCDAAELVTPDVDGAVRAMRQALADAGWDPGSVDYVSAHGTGTVLNDLTETRALHAVFGAHAGRLLVSSTKGAHGHALGASPALELVATIRALHEGVVPPTLNYLGPDPECDLDYVPLSARRAPIVRALSNAFGFGGLNAVLAVTRA